MYINKLNNTVYTDNIEYVILIVRIIQILDKCRIISQKTTYIHNFEELEGSILTYFYILSLPGNTLLKEYGFRYEGYPFDGYDGQRSYNEDVNLLCYCYEKDIKVAIIDALYFVFDYSQPTVCWGDRKTKEKMNFYSLFWLLYKYKENEDLVKYIIAHLISIINNFHSNTSKELFEGLFKELSYESLNNEEELSMKREILIGGLVLLLSMGFIACPTDNKGGGEEETKKVDAKFQGEWDYKTYDGQGDYFKITETEFLIMKPNDQTSTIGPAWSEGNTFWYQPDGNNYSFELSSDGKELTSSDWHMHHKDTTLVKR